MASEFPRDTIGPPPVGNGMAGRIQRLLTSPKTEWPAIDAEPMTMQGIITGWVLPLAAIGPIAGMARGILFPIRNPFTGESLSPSIVSLAVQAALALAFTVLGVWVWSLILDALAANFKGVKNQIAAMKLVAFSATAMWLAQVFQITWFTWPLAIVGLYSIYLFWVGVPATVKVPDDQRQVYVLAAVVIGIVVNVIVFWIATAIAGAMFFMTPGAVTAPSGSVTIGGTTIDTGKLAAQADAMKASAEKMQASLAANGGAGAKAVDPAVLQNLLPAALSGWNRTSIESSGGGAMGVNISDATADFTAGDQSFHLKISDTGAMGALAGMVNVQSSRQTATGYEKTALQDGNMVTEKWDNTAKQGTYSVLVGKRFLVEAEGSAPSIDVLKGAVGSVNLASLAALGG